MVVRAGLFVVDEAEMGRVEDREVRLLEVGVDVADVDGRCMAHVDVKEEGIKFRTTLISSVTT